MKQDSFRANGTRQLSRRGFLQTLATGLGTAVLLPQTGWTQLTQIRVVQATNGLVWQDGQLQDAIARKMLDAALMELTGEKDLTEAWQSLLLPEDFVGIKLSAESDPRFGPHRVLVDAVVEGVRSAGVPDAQILIWDRMEDDLLKLGHQIQMGQAGMRCYATDKTGPGYDARIYYDTAEDVEGRREDGSTRSHFSKIITQDVTRIINIATLKQHIATGVSLTLKSLAFGSVNNTARFNGNPVNGEPAIAEICDHAMLRDKPVLHLIDGLVGCFAGGPEYTEEGTWEASTLLASFDPVALDQTGYQLIEAKRKEAGLPSIQSKAKHIRTAARLGLGTNTPDDIDIREVKMEVDGE